MDKIKIICLSMFECTYDCSKLYIYIFLSLRTLFVDVCFLAAPMWRKKAGFFWPANLILVEGKDCTNGAEFFWEDFRSLDIAFGRIGIKLLILMFSTC